MIYEWLSVVNYHKPLIRIWSSSLLFLILLLLHQDHSCFVLDIRRWEIRTGVHVIDFWRYAFMFSFYFYFYLVFHFFFSSSPTSLFCSLAFLWQLDLFIFFLILSLSLERTFSHVKFLWAHHFNCIEIIDCLCRRYLKR